MYPRLDRQTFTPSDVPTNLQTFIQTDEPTSRQTYIHLHFTWTCDLQIDRQTKIHMGGWINGQTDRQIFTRTERLTDRQILTQTYVPMDRKTGRHSHGQMHRPTHIHTDVWIYRQTDIQTFTWTDRSAPSQEGFLLACISNLRQTFGLRPQVCLQKVFWELSHNALGRCESSHGALPLGMFYLPTPSAFPVFIPDYRRL